MANSEFIISREFDAPRDLVWKAWTDRERMGKWWGPKGFTVDMHTLELRPGGINLYCMRMPDGTAMWGKFTYREIMAPEKLVYVNAFCDENGGLTRHPFHSTWPLELLSTIRFEEQGNKTKVTIKWVPLDADPEEIQTFEGGRAGMELGWGGTLDQLAQYLATQKK